jgi:hypothetical protein
MYMAVLDVPAVSLQSVSVGLANLRVDGWEPLIQLVFAADLQAKS